MDAQPPDADLRRTVRLLQRLDARGVGDSRNSDFGLPAGGTVAVPTIPRPNNWEEAVSVQHELFPRISVTAGYYHRTFYHLQYTKNTAVDPTADYTPFTVIVPANANL